MPETFDALEDKLRALDQQGEETTEKVDLLIAMVAALKANDPRRILALAQEAYALAERLAYRRGMAYGLGYMGFAHYMLSEHETAHATLRQGLDLIDGEDDPDGKAKIVSALAGVMISLGNYDQALVYGIEALKLFQQTGNRYEEAWTMIGFGSAFVDFGAYDRALQFFEDALAIFEGVGERVGEARALNGIGTVYHSTDRYDDALPYHVKSLALFEETNNRIGEARALNDLGVVYHHLGDDAKALAYHQQSLAIREEVDNRQSQSTSLIHLGTIYRQQGRTDEALEALRRALAIAEAVKARLRIYQAHQALAEVYEQRGDLAEALHHHKAYHQLREAVMGEETQAKLSTLQIRFGVEQAEREAEIERLRNVELKQKNDELERVLRELKAAQAQLVQSEKMASLGQLTAGIAHEIKNPLNFVNNFSLLSIELANELRDELDAHADEPVAAIRDDLAALLDDLRFNAERISRHGQRADGIVRAMMQHARGGRGERRAADLNALLDEYVNLAYHGMRASNPDFTVTIERDYDEAVGAVEVVPQEMGRVFINLLNNAFYAVYERAREAAGSYVPRVSVSTRRAGKQVAVRVADNGPGIAAALREKIFEPFFTTKPTGSGTGLGLSISYDIVTQGHGGTMTVESTEGAGVAFVVRLPAQRAS